MNRFDAKTIIVTGGAGGIGNAICRRFAAEGGHVWILDSNEEAAAVLLPRSAISAAR